MHTPTDYFSSAGMGIMRIVACHRRISLWLTMPATFTKLLAWRLAWLAGLLLFGALVGRADTHYVWRDNPAPVSPYTNGWASASTQIQAAVDAAVDGDTVLVTNGMYDTGGGLSNPGGGFISSNRVYVGKAITIRSVNGAAVTIIKGAPDPITGECGSNAVRCVSLWAAASLIGFTLTNGYSATGDNSWQKVGGGLWLYNASAVVSNCVIVGNYSARLGGGVNLMAGTLDSCTVSGNTAAVYGGGIRCSGAGSSAINNCAISANRALNHGGGIFSDGGAPPTTIIKNCTVAGNYAVLDGGGVQIHYTDGTLRNCLIVSNTCGNHGGGVFFGGTLGEGVGLLENCTVAGNSSGVRIANKGVLTNCIVWGNSNYNFDINEGETVSYTCSDPVQAGTGNTGADPLFVNTNSGNYRLTSGSPCVNTGTNQAWMTNAVDLDGRIRIRYGIVDMGAYELIYKGSVFSFQ